MTNSIKGLAEKITLGPKFWGHNGYLFILFGVQSIFTWNRQLYFKTRSNH